MSQPTLTYSRYLKLDALLHLQQPLSDGPEHDETLFIIIHQVYELWFKQLLHEVSALGPQLARAQTLPALATLRRVLTILKTLVAQVDVLETMTPLSFGAFRTRLEAASGFQSAQFRALEFALGAKRAAMMAAYAADDDAQRMLQRWHAAPGLYDHFLAGLALQGWPVPSALLTRDVTSVYEGSPEVQMLLIDLYRRGDAVAQLCERLVDLDEGLQEWRYRHVKMVERTIGVKPGTGGSPGAAYLRETLFRPLFPDLWAIRSRF
ncbi:MAG TPA: tryptophan 2,3-dioxygenase family protein [Solimonas sp.]